MAQEPAVYVTVDNSAITPIADTGSRVLVLGEAQDGPSLNEEGKLLRLDDVKEVRSRLGPNVASKVMIDVLASFHDIARVPVLFGRITGVGGAAGATADIDNLAAPAAAQLKATWRGKGVVANQYSLVIARGQNSTANAGAGRVDTKITLIETASNSVIASLDGLNMSLQSQDYAISRWNALETLCALSNLAPTAVYAADQEPAVGTYAFTGGAEPAAATTTQRQAAVDKLEAIANLDFTLVGILNWETADVNKLAGVADKKRWVIINYLPDGTTPASAKTFNEAINVKPSRVTTHRGWGVYTSSPGKRIPGLGQVLAQAVVAARAGQDRLVNVTGAGVPVDRWISFDTESTGWADGRTNPLFFRRSRYGDGVVIGDVLSLSKERRYAQWGSRRADDLITGDVVDYLESVVKNNPDFPWGDRKTDDVSRRSADKIDDAMVNLFAQYPPNLLTGGRGVGWDWRFEDVSQGADGPEPIFLLGTDPAKVGRVFYVRLGQVAGRFTVTGQQVGQEV